MSLAKTRLFSDALGMSVTVDVILPQPEHWIPGRKIPVLWLLHGACAGYSQWLRLSGIERYVWPYNLAVVMPSAENSGYADMAHGGSYYTFISEELPRKLRTIFNFSAKREDNFIAGLSMGGKGSLLIGLNNPEKYSVIGCLSAGIENAQGSFVKGRRYELIHGDGTEQRNPRLDGYEAAKRIVTEGLPAPRIYHACGTEDFLLPSAHDTRDFLSALPFEYTYVEGPGAHTWDFWDTHIREFIQFLHLPLTE